MATKVTDELPNRDKESESSDSEASATAEIDLEEESDESDESEDEAERWHRIREPVQPQPGPFKDVDDFYAPKESARLSEKFKDSGLQIIVKMASIELTPEKPEFPAGGWHVSYQ
jgi:hypothetical protein